MQLSLAYASYQYLQHKDLEQELRDNPLAVTGATHKKYQNVKDQKRRRPFYRPATKRKKRSNTKRHRNRNWIQHTKQINLIAIAFVITIAFMVGSKRAGWQKFI